MIDPVVLRGRPGDDPPLSTLYYGADVRETLRRLPENSIQCAATSPPYWGLRDYGTGSWEGGDSTCNHQQGRPGAGRADGVVDNRAQRNRDGVAGLTKPNCAKCGATRIDRQIGLEETPEAFVTSLVEVFREVHRVLRDDGTLWVNLGDSYCGPPKGNPGTRGNINGGKRSGKENDAGSYALDKTMAPGIKPKDLVGIPWRVAFALQADGWYLRQDIIWSKTACMPESVTDRCTKSHEYVFLFTKSPRYLYDAEAVKEPPSKDRYDLRTSWNERKEDGAPSRYGDSKSRSAKGFSLGSIPPPEGRRNRRSVWTISPKPYRGAHFATWPEELVEIMLKAGAGSKRATVLDPFSGSATTGVVANRLNHHYIGIDLNPDYLDLATRRLQGIKESGTPSEDAEEEETSILDLF